MPEQRLTIPSGDITLEAVLDTPAGSGPFPGVVVCHPHPQYGGDLHNNVVLAAVRGLGGRGIASLRFNFRGVGASGGSHTRGERERDDVRAALDALAARPEIDPARVGLAGYSFGAWMAALAAEPRTSLPADAAAPETAQGTASSDARALALIALPLGTGPDLSGTLPAYPGPILLVAGDRDTFCPAAELHRFAATLRDAQVRIVTGADHFWSGYERELEVIIGDFFAPALS